MRRVHEVRTQQAVGVFKGYAQVLSAHAPDTETAYQVDGSVIDRAIGR